MRKLRTLIGLAAMVGLAGTGRTQGSLENPTGSLVGRPKPADIPEYARLTSEDRGRETLNEFAACVVGIAGKGVNKYLAYKADDVDGRRYLVKLAANDCLRYGELKAPTILFRGAVFRALYIRDFKTELPTLSEKAVDFAAYLGSLKAPDSVQYIIMMDFADCVVRADVADSDKFVRGHAGDRSEKDAFSALMPKLGPCLPQGMKAELNKSYISAVLAEALYQEALAGRAPAPKGAE